MNMDFFTKFLTMIKAAAPTIEADIATAESVIAEIESILGSPSGTSTVGSRLNGLIAKVTTHTATPGAALVIEPKAASGG